MTSTTTNAVIIISVVIIGFLVLHNRKSDVPLVSRRNPQISPSYTPREFSIYNHYLVPIKVYVKKQEQQETLLCTVKAQQRSSIASPKAHEWMVNGTDIIVKARIPGKFHDDVLATTSLSLPPNKTIKSLHIGMISAHTDISEKALKIYSPIGSAIPRLRIVNHTELPLQLGPTIYVSPHNDFSYLGERGDGIHMGVKLRDKLKLFPDYVIDKPITDVHYGIISDVEAVLYGGSRYGGDYDDNTEPLVEYRGELYQHKHTGADVDRTVITSSWI